MVLGIVNALVCDAMGELPAEGVAQYRRLPPILARVRCRCQCAGKRVALSQTPEMPMRRRALLGVASLPAIAWPHASPAQAFPTKPITIVVPYTAGGPLDTTCRILAEHMQGTLGQTIVIDNVAGAGGAIAVSRTARANPERST